jgi:ankyrin repeat protein
LNVVSAVVSNIFFPKACVLTDSETATPLHLICASSDPQTKLGLIKIVGTAESAVAKDNNDKTPFLLAVENPNTTKKVIQELGELNADAAKMEDSKGRLPFHLAIRLKAHESIVKAILKLHPKAVRVVFDCNNNIFHEMCQYETAPGIISGLLQVYPEGAEERNAKGNVPLHVAAAYKLSLQAIEALISAYPEGCLVQNKSKELPL